MTKSEQLALIHKAFYSLPDLQDGLRDVRELIFGLCLTSEKAHRKGQGTYYGCSLVYAAQYFTVRYLLDGWEKSNQYTVDDITIIRNEALYAQAYAKRFHKELKEWALAYSHPFDAVDYCDIIK
jgi:hypothetical protein